MTTTLAKAAKRPTTTTKHAESPRTGELTWEPRT